MHGGGVVLQEAVAGGRMLASGMAAERNGVLPDSPRFPFRRLCPFDPPPEYAKARAAGPLHSVTLWNGKRAWLVTRYEEVRAVLMDDRRFSGAMAQPGFPTVTEARVTVDRNERAFVGMDNPRHDRRNLDRRPPPCGQ